MQSRIDSAGKYSDVRYSDVFGHRTMKVSHPVRSAVDKHRIAWLVLLWVTMWESRVLNSYYFWFSGLGTFLLFFFFEGGGEEFPISLF